MPAKTKRRAWVLSTVDERSTTVWPLGAVIFRLRISPARGQNISTHSTMAGAVRDIIGAEKSPRLAARADSRPAAKPAL